VYFQELTFTSQLAARALLLVMYREVVDCLGFGFGFGFGFGLIARVLVGVGSLLEELVDTVPELPDPNKFPTATGEPLFLTFLACRRVSGLLSGKDAVRTGDGDLCLRLLLLG
jgi:hypothetical protein